MKLRLRGDSLRLRLTQKEVLQVRDEGFCQQETNFAPSGLTQLGYRVEASDEAAPEVHFSSGALTLITVALPKASVNEWAEGTHVGIYFEEAWGLKIAVEKDFRCLDPQRDEDESDNFDNPNAGDSTHGECHVEED